MESAVLRNFRFTIWDVGGNDKLSMSYEIASIAINRLSVL